MGIIHIPYIYSTNLLKLKGVLETLSSISIELKFYCSCKIYCYSFGFKSYPLDLGSRGFVLSESDRFIRF